MGELVLKALKVGLVILVIALVGNFMITINSIEWDGFSTLWTALSQSPLWTWLTQGINLAKWLFGAVPVAGMFAVGSAFFAFSIAGRFVDFIRRTFLD